MKSSLFTGSDVQMPQGGAAATFNRLMTGGGTAAASASVYTLFQEVFNMDCVSSIFICLFFSNNDVFLVQNRTTGMWEFPGGSVESNERAWKAVA